MDLTLPASAAGLRQAADALVTEILEPAATGLPPAEGAISAGIAVAVHRRRSDLGLWGLSVPRELGGRAAGWLEQALVQERVQRSLVGLWGHGLWTWGEPPAPLWATRGAQRAAFLEPCLAGTQVAHQLVVPRAAGDGAPGLACAPDGDGAILSGRWPAVPALQTAGLLVVIAEMAGAPVGLLCDGRLVGYRLEHLRPGMGSVELVDIVWDRCRLGPERLLVGVGEAAEAWRALQQIAYLGAGALGAAARCLELGLAHARQRRTFGRPLADRQAIQWMLADSARELQEGRLLLYRAATLADQGDVAAAVGLAGPAKAYATDAACRIVDRMLQLHGGYGYTRDLPLERFWRDLRFYRLAEGRNEELVAGAAASLLAALDA